MKYLTLVIVVFTLAACGGGGGGGGSCDDNTDGTAEGLWHGSTVKNETQSVLVLDDGTFWLIYSAPNRSTTAGFGQGNGTSSSGCFSSSNALQFDFGQHGFEKPFGFSGIYKAMSSFKSQLVFGSIIVSTSLSYDSQYDITPSLTAIAGTYSGQAVNLAGNEVTTVVISSTGAINGNFAGCTFTGNASTRANGNVYDVTITFDGGVCLRLTGTVTGQAYFDAPTKQFTSAAINSTRTDGFIYIGTKP